MCLFSFLNMLQQTINRHTFTMHINLSFSPIINLVFELLLYLIFIDSISPFLNTVYILFFFVLHLRWGIDGY